MVEPVAAEGLEPVVRPQAASALLMSLPMQESNSLIPVSVAIMQRVAAALVEAARAALEAQAARAATAAQPKVESQLQPA